MENDMPVKQAQQPPVKSEREQEIERLQAQVKRADERGQTDTCHHEMLRRLTGEQTIKEQ
jgi:hypothetical protein